MPKATPDSKTLERSAAGNNLTSGLPILILALLLAAGTGIFAAWGLPLPAAAEGPESAPGAPDTPTGTAKHAGIVDVEWKEVDGADSYELQVFLGQDWIDLPGEGMQVSFYGAGAVVRNIQEEGRYTFRVRSRNAHGVSSWSDFKSMPATGIASQWDHLPIPQNAPATGKPIVTGVPIIEETLTSDISNITDENGLQRIRFHYQWVRSTTGTESDIAGATTPRYVITEDDESHEIKLNVSFTDRGGYKEAVTSQPTSAVLPALTDICSRTAAVKTAILADPAVSSTDCTQADLRQMGHITELNLKGESLAWIQAGDFTGLTGIKDLDLSQNLITSLPAGVFDHLSALESLDLSDNNLESIPSDAFQALASLEEMDLARTNLDAVPKDALQALAGLERLDLSHNNVDSVPADAFEQLPRLAALDLSHNDLESVPKEALNHLNGLTSLHLGYNRISALTPGTFNSLTALTELTIGYNQLVSLPPGALDSLTGLEVLDLSHNGLRSLSEDTFDRLTGLSRLNLEANHLTGLPAGLLAQTSGLVELRLGDNPLTGLPDGFLDSVSALTYLNMSDNALMQLRPGTFEPLSSLTDLELGGVHYSPHLLADLKYLRNLDGAPYSRPAAPRTPTALTAGWKPDRRELTWNAPATGEAATSYQISRSSDAEPWEILVHDTFTLEEHSHHHGDQGEDKEDLEGTETTELSYADNAVTAGITYRYRVRALNAGGSGPESEAAEAAVPVGACQRTIQVEKALTDLLEISEDDCEALASADLAALSTLDLSGQSIGLLQEGDFQGLTGLTTLDLSANALRTLPSRMFSQLDSLSTLDLRDNPDLSYSPHLLSLLTGLTTLDGEDYTAPDAPEAATGLSASQSQGNVILAWHPPGSGPTPSSYRILWAQGDAEMEIHVEDTFGHETVHEEHGDTGHSGHGHSEETVRFTDTASVPGNTYRYSVQTLGAGGKGPKSNEVELTVESLSICGRTTEVRDAILKTLGTSDCANVSSEKMAAITVLNLSFTGVKSVKAGDFDGLDSLELLDMCLTCLKTIGPGALTNLKHLKALELYWSCLEELPPDAFQGLESLERLAMYRNYRLETIPADLFDGLTNLKTLRMDRTGLTTLPDGIFDDLTSLEWLATSDGNGPAYSPYLISHLTNLSQLDYSDAAYTRPLSPPAPAGLTATHQDGSVNLAWAAPAGGTRATSYRIHRRAGDGTWKVLVKDTWYEGRGAATYTDSEVQEGVTYLYSVSSLNAGGAGPRSSNAQVTVPSDNYAPTGRPTIAGKPRVEETLRAITSGISDEDGLTNVSYRYQWSANGIDITGATGSRYLLTAAEQGENVQVKVTFTDDGGNEHTLTSAASTAITPAPETWQATLTVAARDGAAGYSYWGQPVLGSLTPTELEWHGSTHYIRYILLQNGELWLGLNNEMLSTGFVLSSGNHQFGSADAEVDEDGASYRFRWDDPGLAWPHGDEVTVTLTESSQNTPALGRPTITGTPVEHGTLQADISELKDADGTENTTFSYQWVSNDGNTDTDLEYETAASYNVTGDDVGNTIQVRVSFVDDRDNEETLTSAPTEAVTAAAKTPEPVEEGTETAEDENAEDWTAALTVGVWGSGTEATWGYSWFLDGMGNVDQRTYTDGDSTIEVMAVLLSNGFVAFNVRPHPDTDFLLTMAGTRFASANASKLKSQTLISYVWLATLDWAEGDEIRLTLTLEDPDSRNQPEPTVNAPPTGRPIISGTPQAGQTLTADTSTIADEDGLSNVSYRQQWIANDGTDADIYGATGPTYTPSVTDVGKTIKVRVSYTDNAGNEESLTSAATGDVAAKPAEPLTAALTNVPATHNGGPFTFELDFSVNVKSGYANLRDHAFTVTGGQVSRAQRRTQGTNQYWLITIEPDGSTDVTVTLPVTTDCSASGAICDYDGNALSNSPSATVEGP